jgi:hypothetical protein
VISMAAPFPLPFGIAPRCRPSAAIDVDRRHSLPESTGQDAPGATIRDRGGIWISRHSSDHGAERRLQAWAIRLALDDQVVGVAREAIDRSLRAVGSRDQSVNNLLPKTR